MVNKKIQLQDDGVNLYPLAMFNGINTSDVIASGITFPYTANQDCYGYFYIGTNNNSFSAQITIDGQDVISAPANVNVKLSNIIPLKKGQVVDKTARCEIYNSIIYGIKR